MVGIREPIMPTNHKMFLGVLIGEGFMRYCAYVKGHPTWPIQEEKGGTRQEGASNSRALKRRVKKPSRKDITNSAL